MSDGIDIKVLSYATLRARCPLCGGGDRPCSTMMLGGQSIVVIGCPCVEHPTPCPTLEGKSCPVASHAADCTCMGEGGDR